jgi:hypothetical protein
MCHGPLWYHSSLEKKVCGDTNTQVRLNARLALNWHFIVRLLRYLANDREPGSLARWRWIGEQFLFRVSEWTCFLRFQLTLFLFSHESVLVQLASKIGSQEYYYYFFCSVIDWTVCPVSVDYYSFNEWYDNMERLFGSDYLFLFSWDIQQALDMGDSFPLIFNLTKICVYATGLLLVCFTCYLFVFFSPNWLQMNLLSLQLW